MSRKSFEKKYKEREYQHRHYYKVCLSLNRSSDRILIYYLSKLPKGKINEYLKNVIDSDLHSEFSFFDDYFDDKDNVRFK